jgi:fatty acid desaturase
MFYLDNRKIEYVIWALLTAVSFGTFYLASKCFIRAEKVDKSKRYYKITKVAMMFMLTTVAAVFYLAFNSISIAVTIIVGFTLALFLMDYIHCKVAGNNESTLKYFVGE